MRCLRPWNGGGCPSTSGHPERTPSCPGRSLAPLQKSNKAATETAKPVSGLSLQTGCAASISASPTHRKVAIPELPPLGICLQQCLLQGSLRMRSQNVVGHKEQHTCQMSVKKNRMPLGIIEDAGARVSQMTERGFPKSGQSGKSGENSVPSSPDYSPATCNSRFSRLGSKLFPIFQKVQVLGYGERGP